MQQVTPHFSSACLSESGRFAKLRMRRVAAARLTLPARVTFHGRLPGFQTEVRPANGVERAHLVIHRRILEELHFVLWMNAVPTLFGMVSKNGPGCEALQSLGIFSRQFGLQRHTYLRLVRMLCNVNEGTPVLLSVYGGNARRWGRNLELQWSLLEGVAALFDGYWLNSTFLPSGRPLKPR
jgi:hypothetical protein